MSISHRRKVLLNRGRNRSPRPKSFKSELTAKAYAERNNIKNAVFKKLMGGHKWVIESKEAVKQTGKQVNPIAPKEPSIPKVPPKTNSSNKNIEQESISET